MTISKFKIKMKNPSQEPPATPKAPNQDFKDLNVLCTFKIKTESKKFEQGSARDQWPYPNQDQDAKPPSGTSSVLQSPKSALSGHGYSLHIQNHGRESKFRTGDYQRPLTIYKSISRCQTPIRNLQGPLKPQIRTWRTLILESLYFENGSVWSHG